MLYVSSPPLEDSSLLLSPFSSFLFPLFSLAFYLLFLPIKLWTLHWLIHKLNFLALLSFAELLDKQGALHLN